MASQTVPGPIPVAIVPHTHWDREWYAPFQTYRLRLIALLDDFLPLLDRDPGYRHFLLDGQTAVLDDYLEVRPEAEDQLRRLVVSGRLSIGPWMILMDEFMVSGETMIRNLQFGLARAAEFGGAMEVGYLPDMFGHIAQMPQILKLAGLDHAVVWRGVPMAIRSTGFWWEAPDGSRVRAEYLYGSYSNGRDIPRDPASLVERAKSYEAELGQLAAGRLDGMLLMNGTDHQVPQPWLGAVVDGANAAQDGYHFRVTSLTDHLARQPVDGLPTWEGELRSGARANLLMGVASNRVDVHQAAAAAERAMERRAEPMAALALAPDRYPARLLELAWRDLVLNSAHDSSCACSHDEVVDQVLVRYREARQIGDGVGREAVRTLAMEVGAPAGSAVVVNPSAHARRGLVEMTLPGEGPLHFLDPDGRPRPAQIVAEETGERFATQVVGTKIGWVLDMLRGEEFAGAPVKGFSVEERSAGVWDVTVQAAGPGDDRIDVELLRERLVELAVPASRSQGRSGPATPDDEVVFSIRVVRAPARRVLLAADVVPGYGWTSYEPRDGEAPDAVEGFAPVTASAHGLANEHLEVEVSPDDGTFRVTTADGLSVAGLNRYVNGGDGGDTYNYSPPAEDVVVESPDTVTAGVVEAGPLRGRITITSTYEWPLHAEGDERKCVRRAPHATHTVSIGTSLELRAGEPFVRVHTHLDNPCRDQRLRAHFPLPAKVDGSDAECAFGVVHRGLTAEGGPSEFGLPTFPSRRFVDCSGGGVGLALIHDGLLEYEVVGDGSEVALTLMRSVGWLSRLEPDLRPNPAGPPVRVEGAQMLGLQRFEYAVMLHAGTWEDARLYEVADGVLLPLDRAPALGPAGPRPASGRLLGVEGAVVSSCSRVPGGLTVRVFNPSRSRSTFRIDGADGWVVDLRGAPVDRFDGSADLRPGQILTVLLPDR
ncbi:MAG: alpha-mannosidase [Actinobacteria bacterium]|nr:alpha-mannosidase [Actinomycetota bacterium]